MVVVLAFGEQAIRVISAYKPQAGRPLEEKHRFYDELAAEYEVQNPCEVVFGLGDFNGHVGEEIEGFESVQGGNGIGKRNSEKKIAPWKLEHQLLVVDMDKRTLNRVVQKESRIKAHGLEIKKKRNARKI